MAKYVGMRESAKTFSGWNRTWRACAILNIGVSNIRQTDQVPSITMFKRDGRAESPAAQGVPVVGLNSLRYYWMPKTPEQASSDLNRILRHYGALWKREKVVTIGYSFGADVLPFAVNRLPREVQARIEVIALLGPSPRAEFEFHLTDWIGNFQRSDARPVRPEIEKLRGKHILCFYGTSSCSS